MTKQKDSNTTVSPLIWESRYSEGLNIARIPYTEVLTFLIRYFNGECRGKKLLEIGCGVGNNLLFAAWELGMEIYGIDFSQTAIDIAKQKFKKLEIPYNLLEKMDAMDMVFDDAYFDAVIDRGALQCNTLNRSRDIVAEISRVLKPEGSFYTTVTSQDHHLFFSGNYVGDGAFNNEKNDGVRQFFSNHQIYELMNEQFEILEWRKIEDFNVLKNTRTAIIHHVGCRKVAVRPIE